LVLSAVAGVSAAPARSNAAPEATAMTAARIAMSFLDMILLLE
jgi:hypothetical protein